MTAQPVEEGGAVVITGATGALGAALTRHLVRLGRKVAALGSPRAAKADQAGGHGLGELVSETGCLGIAMDVASPADWTENLARIERELGPVGGAVLIAGGWKGGVPLHAETDDAVWRAMISSNLETAQRSLRALLPGMVARGTGSIVVIGSRAAVQPWTSAGASAYAAAKAAVVAVAQAAAAEVLESGVRINAVLPSTIDTPANRRAMPAADPARWVSTESLSRVIAFLLSDDARDVSGVALPVYGRS